MSSVGLYIRLTDNMLSKLKFTTNILTLNADFTNITKKCKWVLWIHRVMFLDLRIWVKSTCLLIRRRGYLTIGSCRVTGRFFFFSPAEPRRRKYNTVTTTTEAATSSGSVCKTKVTCRVETCFFKESSMKVQGQKRIKQKN